MTATIAANAQTPLQPQIVLRPLSAVDRSTYGLSADTELSGGLSTVGIGTAVYLETDVNIAFPLSDITSVKWTLTSKPTGSMVTLTDSPLGTNVPIYEPSDRLVSQVASRTLLRPDLVGQYTVTATIATASEGTTNLTQMITAGTYMGVQTCELCHSGGLIAENIWATWSQTLHAQIFSGQIDGLIVGPLTNHVETSMRESCLQCHTTGYDVLGTNAPDGGFSDLEGKYGWTIPTVLTNGNWASMQTNYPQVANLANVQCESCHGPGSQHVMLIGNTSSPDWPSISVNHTSGDCNQCHDDAKYHPYGTEWLNSVHAVTTRHPAGNASCVGCHTGTGFAARMDGETNIVDTAYVPINCQACHDPMGDTNPPHNPHMIRAMTPVTLMDGTTVTNAGEGLLCMQCHHAREDAATYASTYHSHFGPHHGPQADMVEGVNGFTYGEAIPSSAHRTAVPNLCVTCHMQNVPSTDPDFTYVGAHTFKPGWDGDATHPAEDLVGACQQCHGPAITDFDFPLQDYDGDGVIDGVQTEVQHLLDKLALLLPPAGQAKTTVSPDPTWTAPQLEAAYNWMFVNNDGSLGIHNTAYAVGLLKASIANLTGDANNDGLPDAWQIQYFGSATSPDAAPNATPAGDGVPNWLKYALGLDPTKAGISVPGGVVWADGKGLVNPPINPSETNTIEIYTAAEVSFNTQTNETYQIQAISSVGGNWQNVGEPVAGTGMPYSYVTPTRDNVQMFFRVVHTP